MTCNPHQIKEQERTLQAVIDCLEATLNQMIIKSVGGWGILTYPYYHSRLTTPLGGDIVDFGDNVGDYPYVQKYGRIDRVDGWGVKDTLHICHSMGSAHLHENGNVSISGGPFTFAPIEWLEPTKELYRATYWNWYTNGVGGGHGVRFQIKRPLFRLKKINDEMTQLLAQKREAARKEQ